MCFFSPVYVCDFYKKTVHLTKLGQAQSLQSLNELLHKTQYVKRDKPLQLSIIQYTADVKQGN